MNKLTIAILLFLSFQVNAQWQKLEIPKYDKPFTEYLDAFPNKLIVRDSLFLVTVNNHGLALSTNYGKGWKYINNGITGPNISAILLVDNYLYAGTSNKGMFRSADMGEHWEEINSGLISSSISIIIEHNNGIYISTGSGIYSSYDRGSNWQKTTNFSVRVLKSYNHKLYYGANDGLYLSIDHGSNWNKLQITGNNVMVFDLFLDDSKMYVGSPDGIYISEDVGKSWVNRKHPVWSDVGKIFAIRNNIFAVSNNGTFFSPDNGINWDSQFHSYSSLDFLMENQNLFMTSYDGIYLVTHNGKVWCKSKLEERFNYANTLVQLKGSIYAGTGWGILTSSDKGNSWHSVKVGDFYCNVNSIEIIGETLYAGTMLGVFYSIDYGITWKEINKGLNGKEVRTLRYMNNNLYACTNLGIFRFENTLDSWIELNKGLANLNVMDISSSGSNFYAGTDGGVYTSNDLGNNWTSINNGLGNKYVTSIIEDKGTLIAGTFNGIYVTSKGNVNWQKSSKGIEGTGIYSFIKIGDSTLVATYSGIYCSTDQGANWIRVGSKYWTSPENNYPYNFLKAYTMLSYNNSLYVGTCGTGIFKTPIITSLDDPHVGATKSIPNNFELSQNYPNPFNPSTTIEYQLPTPGFVTLKVYDLLGREVATLVNEYKQAGSYNSKLNTQNYNLTSGVYFYRLQAGSYSQTKKLMLLK